MPDAYIEWRGDEEVLRRMREYERKVLEAVKAVADYFAPIVEQYAKDNAPWTDRTANARQSLHAFTQILAEGVVALYLSHGVNYGVSLELAHQGRYAIILPALEAHYEPISRMLKGIFG